MSRRLHLSVILTHDCDMRCHYCTAVKQPVAISTPILERVVELAGRSEATEIDLNFHGGEPLLAWDRFVELTQLAAELRRGRRVSLNTCTNATQATPERAEFLARHRFNVRVSLDGREESHSRHRWPAGSSSPEGARASFRASVAGLRGLLDSGASTGVNVVVTPETVGQLTENVVYLLKLGLTHLVVSPAIGVAWPDAELLSLDRQLADLSAVYLRLLSRRHGLQRESLRRVVVAEISRASYCLGENPNHPDAQVLVVGPTGKLYGDEPDARTEVALEIGHLDSVESIDDLPSPERTAFQLLYDHQLYSERILRDIKRTHRLLRKRMIELHETLFGPYEPLGRGSPLAG